MTTNNTFVISYGDGTSEIAKPVSWKYLEDIELLQLAILETVYAENFSLSQIFKPKNKKFWDNAKKLAALIPIVGNEEPGFDPEKIEDMDELCRIFISTSTGRQLETGAVIGGDQVLQPSEIARIHHLNFISLLIQIETKANQKQTKKES